MRILGYSISIFFFISLLVLLLMYFFLAFNKKAIAKRLLVIVFYHSLITLLALSWSLIVINDGFDIIPISVDFSYIAIFLIFILLFLTIARFYDKSSSITHTLLFFAIFIVFSANTLLFYFSCHYFNFITTYIA